MGLLCTCRAASAPRSLFLSFAYRLQAPLAAPDSILADQLVRRKLDQLLERRLLCLLAFSFLLSFRLLFPGHRVGPLEQLQACLDQSLSYQRRRGTCLVVAPHLPISNSMCSGRPIGQRVCSLVARPRLHWEPASPCVFEPHVALDASHSYFSFASLVQDAADAHPQVPESLLVASFPVSFRTTSLAQNRRVGPEFQLANCRLQRVQESHDLAMVAALPRPW